MKVIAKKEQLKTLVRQAMISVLEEDVYRDRSMARAGDPFLSGWFSFAGPNTAGWRGRAAHSGIWPRPSGRS